MKPAWDQQWLDRPLSEVNADLPGKSIRFLVFETGLFEYLIFGTEPGKALLQEIHDGIMDEIALELAEDADDTIHDLPLPTDS